MTRLNRKKRISWLRPIVTGVLLLIWLVMNIRVEAGVASPMERALDGLAGGVLLLWAIFFGLSFFKLPNRSGGSGED
ncbi:hypothetical protein [Desulfogranum mediterraneum]|uniref:hypothetical protein n=1 Tax=Desulfogranum mediterraneum TaxID=160661 RepID=UPI000408023F|nr:hypothetical protein [Desulfogranum mediterraneum]